MNERLERVMKNGADKGLAVLLIWDLLSSKEKKDLEKELTFKEIQYVWENALPDSQEKSETWSLAKKKAKNFDDYYWLWKNASPNSPDKSKAWKLAKKTAETFHDYYCIWKNTSSKSRDKNKFWKLVEAKAKTPEDIWVIWREFPEGSLKRRMAWDLLVNADYNACLWWGGIWRSLNDDDPQKNDAFEIIKIRASFRDLFYIWHYTFNESKEREEIWKLIKDRVNNFEDYEELCENIDEETDFHYSMHIEILEKIKHTAKKFDDAEMVLNSTKPNTSERDEAIKIAISQAQTFEEWECVWNKLPSDSSQKPKVLYWLKARSKRISTKEIDEAFNRLCRSSKSK